MSRKLSGLRAWVVQRLSAMYIALFMIVIGVVVLFGGMPDNYQDWYALWASPFFNLTMLFFILSVLIHAWVGMRDVVIDYVHPPTLRLIVLSALAMGLVACGLWALRIMLNVI